MDEKEVRDRWAQLKGKLDLHYANLSDEEFRYEERTEELLKLLKERTGQDHEIIINSFNQK